VVQLLLLQLLLQQSPVPQCSWSDLSVHLPTPLSDMTSVHVTYNENCNIFHQLSFGNSFSQYIAIVLLKLTEDLYPNSLSLFLSRLKIPGLKTGFQHVCANHRQVAHFFLLETSFQ